MKKDKIYFHGASRLREERERIGFSQLDAEKIFGISRVTWGKYERGETTPGAEVLEALAVKGADVVYILTGKRQISSQLSSDEKVVIDCYRLMAEETRATYKTIGAALTQPKDDKKAG